MAQQTYRISGATITHVVVALTLFVACGTTTAQIAKADQLSDRIGALAHGLLSRNIAGISIAVARDEKIFFARGYGMANVEHSVALTSDTVFPVASISKNILAGVLLQLVDEGKLSLDDDVTKYVPEAPRKVAWSRYDASWSQYRRALP